MSNTHSVRAMVKNRIRSAKCRPGQILKISGQSGSLLRSSTRIHCIGHEPASEPKSDCRGVSDVLVHRGVGVKESLGYEQVWFGVLFWVM